MSLIKLNTKSKFAFRNVSLKDVENGEVQVLYDAKKAISKLETPVLNNAKVLLKAEEYFSV